MDTAGIDSEGVHRLSSGRRLASGAVGTGAGVDIAQHPSNNQASRGGATTTEGRSSRHDRRCKHTKQNGAPDSQGSLSAELMSQDTSDPSTAISPSNVLPSSDSLDSETCRPGSGKPGSGNVCDQQPKGKGKRKRTEKQQQQQQQDDEQNNEDDENGDKEEREDDDDDDNDDDDNDNDADRDEDGGASEGNSAQVVGTSAAPISPHKPHLPKGRRRPNLNKPYIEWPACWLQKACSARGIRGHSRYPQRRAMVSGLTALDVQSMRPSPYYSDITDGASFVLPGVVHVEDGVAGSVGSNAFIRKRLSDLNVEDNTRWTTNDGRRALVVATSEGGHIPIGTREALRAAISCGGGSNRSEKIVLDGEEYTIGQVADALFKDDDGECDSMRHKEVDSATNGHASDDLFEPGFMREAPMSAYGVRDTHSKTRSEYNKVLGRVKTSKKRKRRGNTFNGETDMLDVNEVWSAYPDCEQLGVVNPTDGVRHERGGLLRRSRGGADGMRMADSVASGVQRAQGKTSKTRRLLAQQTSTIMSAVAPAVETALARRTRYHANEHSQRTQQLMLEESAWNAKKSQEEYKIKKVASRMEHVESYKRLRSTLVDEETRGNPDAFLVDYLQKQCAELKAAMQKDLSSAPLAPPSVDQA